MGPPNIKLGPPAGEHGAYSFYRAFDYLRGGKWRHVTLGEFFFVKVQKDGPVCVGELQLVWTGKQADILSSVRLYYLPEQTPDGRQSVHGIDEMISTDKIVLYAKDLIKWINYEPIDWTIGLQIKKSTNKMCPCNTQNIRNLPCNVKIISYPTYCRLRAAIEQFKLANVNIADVITQPHVKALIGETRIPSDCYVLFSRETFTCPELENHEYRCDHLAPKMKGRPRKKVAMKIQFQAEVKQEALVTRSSTQRSERTQSKQKLVTILTNEEVFLQGLNKFMKDQGTPINKTPSLGFKKVDLFQLFRSVFHLGGFIEAGKKRMWKHLYDSLGGNANNTSAATCTKRLYEKLLLPYEHYIKKEYKDEVFLPHNKSGRPKGEKRKPGRPPNPKPTPPLPPPSPPPADTQPEEDKSESQAENRRPFTRQLSSGKSSRTVQLDQPATHNLEMKRNGVVVASSNTWPVPNSDNIKSDNIPKPIKEENTAQKQEKSEAYAVENKSEIAAEKCNPAETVELKPSLESTSEISVTATEDELKQPSPAHLMQKVLMPLNVLGPCLPTQLVASQLSPWRFRLDRMYSCPDECLEASLKSLASIQLEPTERPVDMRKSLLENRLLNLSRKRPKPAALFQESSDGAIDLTVKRPRNTFSPMSNSSAGSLNLSMQEAFPDMPLNCSLKPNRGAPALPLSVSVHHGGHQSAPVHTHQNSPLRYTSQRVEPFPLPISNVSPKVKSVPRLTQRPMEAIPVASSSTMPDRDMNHSVAHRIPPPVNPPTLLHQSHLSSQRQRSTPNRPHDRPHTATLHHNKPQTVTHHSTMPHKINAHGSIPMQRSHDNRSTQPRQYPLVRPVATRQPMDVAQRMLNSNHTPPSSNGYTGLNSNHTPPSSNGYTGLPAPPRLLNMSHIARPQNRYK